MKIATVKYSNPVEFDRDVNKLLEDGYRIEKLATEQSGNFSVLVAFMLKD